VRAVDDGPRGQRCEHIAHRFPAQRFARSSDQCAKHHGSGPRIVECGVGRGDIQVELFHQSREPGCLALRELQHEPGEGGRVDDRVLEGVLEAAPHQPGVEGVVAVLDEHGAPRKAEECPAHVSEFRRPDQHRAIDLVAPARVRVDGSAAVDQRVEERQRAGEPEPFRSDLEDEERRRAGGLDVEGDELGILDRRLGPELLGIDRDLGPRHRFHGAARLEQDRLLRHLARLISGLTRGLSERTRSRRP
jgi:hypothetical protein